MNVIDRLHRELAYNAWANREALRSVFAARSVPERAGAVVAHIIGAERLWLQRLGHASPPMDVWPTLQPAECESQLRDLSQAWQAYLADLRSESLDQPIHYTNSKGENWS